MTLPTTLAAREGFEVPGAESFYGRPIVELHVLGIDASINRTVVIMFFAVAIATLLFTVAFARPKLVPTGVQNVMEVGVDFIRNNIVLPTMGPAGLPYLPYLTTLFFFVLFCNLFEIIPGISFPATSRLALPLVLAILTWVLFVYAGVKNNGFRYFKDAVVPPGVPKPVLVLLVPVEILSTFILRPLTLTIRLTANMIAGHLLLAVFFIGTAYLLETDGPAKALGAMTGIVSVGFVGFEMFVSGLQAFIFTILTAVYIAGAMKPAH